MLSPARAIFRKLLGHGRRGSQSAPSKQAPATRTESDPAGPPPRAMHISDVRRSPTPTYRRPFPNQTPMLIIVAQATGACVDLYKLLRREKDLWEDDPTEDGGAEYLSDGWVYNVDFITPPTDAAKFGAYLCLAQHFCLVFTYKYLSRESWDETVTAVEAMRRRCTENNVHPSLATVIAATGEEVDEEPAVPHAEAEAFAAHQDALLIKVSLRTGHGICDAVGLLVERANGARDQYADNKEGKEQRYKRAQAFQALFPREG